MKKIGKTYHINHAFLSHLSGDEDLAVKSVQFGDFLSHLSGDEEVAGIGLQTYRFLSHLSGDEARN